MEVDLQNNKNQQPNQNNDQFIQKKKKKQKKVKRESLNNSEQLNDSKEEEQIEKKETKIKEDVSDVSISDEEFKLPIAHLSMEKSPEKAGPTKNTSISSSSSDKEMSSQNCVPDYIDDLIEQLLSVQQKTPGTLVRELKLGHINKLIEDSLQIIRKQPMLLELEAPLVVGTDIHGQYYDLLRFINQAGSPPHTRYLFLGDYVDRGKQSIESLCLLLAYKVKYPDSVFLLRGNHECQNITKIYGFWDECKRRFNSKLWKTFINLFNNLPVAAVVGGRVLCMHGGLSPDLKNTNQILRLQRPSEVPESGILCDLLWSDPAANSSPYVLNLVPKKWGENERGVSYVFGEKVVEEFLQKQELDLIVRGHQVMEEGYEFFAKQKLVTIFSAPNYCNEFDNDGAMLKIGEDLCCSFFKQRPAEKGLTKQQQKQFLWNKKGKRNGSPFNRF